MCVQAKFNALNICFTAPHISVVNPGGEFGKNQIYRDLLNVLKPIFNKVIGSAKAAFQTT